MFNLLCFWLVGSVCGTKLGVSRPHGLSLRVSGTGVLAGTSPRLCNSQLQHLGPRTNTNIAQTSSASEVVYLPHIRTHKPTFEVKGSTEFMDIPDIAVFDPKEFDIFISDVGVSQLRHGITDAAGSRTIHPPQRRKPMPWSKSMTASSMGGTHAQCFRQLSTVRGKHFGWSSLSIEGHPSPIFLPK